MESANIEVHLLPKKGGWITFPFLAASGATSNLIVYLIRGFNVKSIDAAQINNIVNGCTCLAPVAGAIISDSFFGCYPVIAFSTFFNLLAVILFMLTAMIKSLRPSPFTNPSAIQLTVLYAAVALLSVGAGGTRSNMITMGANQFDGSNDQDVFFNWYFVVSYVAAVIGSTVIVYVQDNVNWSLGFGICTVVAVASLVLLITGKKYYRCVQPAGSPFTALARVLVAAFNKRKFNISFYRVLLSRTGKCHLQLNKIIDDLDIDNIMDRSLKMKASRTELDVNSHDIIPKVLPHYQKWTSKYGEVFMYWFGMEPRICITNVELVKQILSNKSGLYVKVSIDPSLLALLGKGLLFTEGADWEKHRKVVSPVFSMNKLKAMTKTMVGCTLCMLDKW